MNWPLPSRRETQYTPEERKELVKVFKLAKERLWDGVGDRYKVEKFICNAALIAALTENPELFAGNALCEIGRRLDGEATLEDWLLEKGVSAWDTKLFQQYRHAWLDQLIEEFST